jgi:hypothetical protein
MFGRVLRHHLAAGLELPAPAECRSERKGAAKVIGTGGA